MRWAPSQVRVPSVREAMPANAGVVGSGGCSDSPSRQDGQKALAQIAAVHWLTRGGSRLRVLTSNAVSRLHLVSLDP